MKMCVFKRPRVDAIGVILFSLVGILVTGCQREVTGTYARSVPGIKERLELRPDGLYVQEIEYSSGARFAQTNHWSRQRNYIVAQHFYATLNPETEKLSEPPFLFTEAKLEIADRLLMIAYDLGYYFRKEESPKPE